MKRLGGRKQGRIKKINKTSSSYRNPVQVYRNLRHHLEVENEDEEEKEDSYTPWFVLYH